MEESNQFFNVRRQDSHVLISPTELLTKGKLTSIVFLSALTGLSWGGCAYFGGAVGWPVRLWLPLAAVLPGLFLLLNARTWRRRLIPLIFSEQGDITYNKKTVSSGKPIREVRIVKEANAENPKFEVILVLTESESTDLPLPFFAKLKPDEAACLAAAISRSLGIPIFHQIR